jgi:hypothetical protein
MAMRWSTSSLHVQKYERQAITRLEVVLGVLDGDVPIHGVHAPFWYTTFASKRSVS